MLSPFEVSTERDTGFVAASALAGGRLASELRDTPVAYSVITRDFIDALNLTDLQSAADWTTGTSYEHDIETPMAFAQAVNYTTRGSSPGAQQRNFFPQRNNIDSYNLERFDFGRGPNAILFGNGSLGGVSSSTTKRARTDRAIRTVEIGIGSWDNYRGTIDVNQPLNDKFAVRAGGRDAGQRWLAVEGIRSAQRRVPHDDVQAVSQHGNPPRGRIHHELSRTRASPRSTSSSPAGTAPRPTTRRVRSRRCRPTPRRSASIGAAQTISSTIRASGIEAIMNYQNDPITRAGGSTATTPIAGFVSGSNAPFDSGGRILHQLNMPAGRFDTAIANSFFRIPSEEFTMNIDAPLLQQRFKDLQLTMNHRIGDFYFEIAGDVNRAVVEVNAEQNRQNNNTYIDINRVKPNGAPNPNFLQPYGDGQFNRSNRNFNYNNRSRRRRLGARHAFRPFHFQHDGRNQRQRDDRHDPLAEHRPGRRPPAVGLPLVAGQPARLHPPLLEPEQPAAARSEPPADLVRR